MASDRILTLTDDTFDGELRAARGPVLVDFWAAWCGPCKAIASSLDELAEELGDRATIAKVDVDANGDLTHRFGIRSIPTLVVFRDGQVVGQMVGAVPKQQIRELLDRHLDGPRPV